MLAPATQAITTDPLVVPQVDAAVLELKRAVAQLQQTIDTVQSTVIQLSRDFKSIAYTQEQLSAEVRALKVQSFPCHV